MFKFSITLFTIFTLLRGNPLPPQTTLQWNKNIFGNRKGVHKIEKHSLNIKTNKNIHCRLKNQKQKRFYQPIHRMNSMIHHLFSLNEMRINGLITKREYSRAKSHTMKKWNWCSIQKPNHVGNSVHLLTAIHKNNGLNEREYIRLKKSLLK